MNLTIFHTAFAHHQPALREGLPFPGVRTITQCDWFKPVQFIEEAEAMAQLAFTLTNHPTPPKFEETREGRCYSMSVGDVVKVTRGSEEQLNLDAYWFVCAPTGWAFLGQNNIGQARYNLALAKWQLKYLTENPERLSLFWEQFAENASA